jgi:hypothetical protein
MQVFKHDDCALFIESLVSLDAHLRTIRTREQTMELFRTILYASDPQLAVEARAGPDYPFDDQDLEATAVLEHLFDIRKWQRIPTGLKVLTIVDHMDNRLNDRIQLTIGGAAAKYKFLIKRDAEGILFHMFPV